MIAAYLNPKWTPPAPLPPAIRALQGYWLILADGTQIFYTPDYVTSYAIACEGAINAATRARYERNQV